MSKRSVVLCCVLFLMAARVAPADPPPADEALVLDSDSPWRSQYAWSPPVFDPPAEAKGDPKPQCDCTGRGLTIATDPPPATWRQIDFDDSSWSPLGARLVPDCGGGGLRSFGYTSGAAYDSGWMGEYLALICARGRFVVSDPAKVGPLSLSLAYRGGVVVYLNGVEVARGSLPAGPIATDTLADAYPLAAHQLDDQPKRARDVNAAGRLRRLDQVKLPTDRLVKGVNVLAVEVHRAPLHPDCRRELLRRGDYCWPTAGLVEVRLAAPAGAAVVPNLVRPAGVRLFNVDPMRSLLDADWADPNVSVAPVRIVGTPNGAFSGVVGVASDAPIRGLSASVGDLAGEGGAAIPASAVEVRYGLPGGREDFAASRHPLLLGKDIRRFDALAPSAPAEVDVVTHAIPEQRGKPARPAPRPGALCPVWLIVNVPPVAAAGRYRGELTVRFDGPGSPLRVPVELRVCRWKLPDPSAFTVQANVYQSPDGVAARYEVPLWSPRHFELIGRSLDLIGRAGGGVVTLPLIAKTNYGNEQSMVRWVRRPDGGFDHDFSVLDRYLAEVAEHMGKPKVVVAQVWEVYSGRGHGAGGPANQGLGPLVTVLDRASGELSELEGPKPGTDEWLAFLRPAVDGVIARLARLGWSDALVLGRGSDVGIDPRSAELLRRTWPNVRWAAAAHQPYQPTIKTAAGPVPVFYFEYVFIRAGVWRRAPHDPACRRDVTPASPDWVFYPRNDLRETATLPSHRLLCERAVAMGAHGFGRIGGDFWSALGYQSRPAQGWVSPCRYPMSSMGRLNMWYLALLADGPDGALPTARWQMVREGVQEAEARLFVERALADAALASRLGEELAGRARAVIDARTRLIRLSEMVTSGTALWYPSSGWQGRSADLFEAAADVAAARGRGH